VILPSSFRKSIWRAVLPASVRAISPTRFGQAGNSPSGCDFHHFDHGMREAVFLR
jgi:hypothetical protein